jgi:tryptophan halogenase
VQNVTIVGGGTAGWLTALILHKRLNRQQNLPRIQVTVIESPTIPIIGVGEGTLPGLVREFKYLGLDEFEILRRCNASFKLGVRFANWNLDRGGRLYSFVHPFTYGGENIAGSNPLDYFLACGADPNRNPNDSIDSLDPVSEAIRLNRAPRAITGEPWLGVFRYAYHIDATQLAEYLREEAVRRGVRHVFDDVEDATVSENGFISHLQLLRNGTLPVELVIDCTGFRSLIISKFLKEPFETYSSHLLCDRAIPMQLPYQNQQTIESCTTATALSAGWTWRIPLYTRVGTGYVYSSAFLTDEDAFIELCRHANADPDKFEARVIQMRVGRLRRSWVGNCIAVGLSGAFIEPLEATAIQSIIMLADQISQHLPNNKINSVLSLRFNNRINAFYDDIRDFIIMHYFLANRSSPFWQAAREQSVLTTSLEQNLEVWKHRLPCPDDFRKPNIFNEKSYAICLASKGFFQSPDFFLKPNLSQAHWHSYIARIDSLRAKARRLPSSGELLSTILTQDLHSQRIQFIILQILKRIFLRRPGEVDPEFGTG